MSYHPPSSSDTPVSSCSSSTITAQKLAFREKGSSSAANNTTTSRSELQEQEQEQKDKPTVYALIDYDDAYVQPLILSAINTVLPPQSLTLLQPSATWNAKTSPEISLAALLPPSSVPQRVLQISPYESIDFDYALTRPASACLVNSYMIRKALIRKHFLSATVDSWVSKNPASILKTHVKRAEHFEVDFAEFLDDALVEAWDLHASLDRNLALAEDEQDRKEWWILKPSMSDRGQGIRLFSSMEELQGIFDGWDEGRDTDDEDDEEENDGIMTSHLRHFVAQPYIHPPLLLPGMGSRKFHVRVYALAVGSMKVYVYRDMLALFASKAYTAPSTAAAQQQEEGEGEEANGEVDLEAHLTNTCLQSSAAYDEVVHRFWDLPEGDGNLTAEKKQDVFRQICEVTGELFEAAARGMMVHFQPMETAFECFGLDFVVDARGTAWLLEVNAFPDFKQTGKLTGVVGGFWKGVVDVAVSRFVHARGSGKEKGDREEEEEKVGEETRGMVLVRKVDLGRRFA